MKSLLQMSEAAIKSNIEHYTQLRDKLVMDAVEAEIQLHKFNLVMEMYNAERGVQPPGQVAQQLSSLVK